ncbi:DUF257 family protein [Pyrococcus sp. ST04]|uniref:DUF257 family protein n=1 Tax=Pyrococcus sp. ST04 TaxID=1183377 RepID=UPI0002605DF2|nr:DUF257 family protein [Pyrococcus sp. ST04]AFK22524.1 hypothetical protein Py04_0942 [Pyrococcus sp. ST04]
MTLQLLNSLILEKKFGETIIVENSAKIGIEILIKAIFEASRILNVPILVEDILDTFPIYAEHLKLMGVDILKAENMKIFKIGGVKDIGEIAKKVPFESDLRMYLTIYREAFEKVAPKEQFFDLVFGLDRLFVLNDNPVEISTIIGAIKEFITNENRIAFYFFEYPLVDNLMSKPLPILEDLVTSVLRLEQDKDTLIVNIIKDIWAMKAKTRKIMIPIRDVFRGNVI